VLDSWEFVDESIQKKFIGNIRILFESINEKFKGGSTCKTLN